MDNIISGFQNPPAQYRPAPLWVWNDEMTKEQIAFQLTELATHGFGGAFVHPRPGLVTEYLSEEWFEIWGYALEKAKELGIKLYIYDENSYPSGFAGGHVSAICPEALATVMRYEVIEHPEQAAKERIAAFAAEEKDGRWVNVRNLSGIPETKWHHYGGRFLIFTSESTGTTGWLAGFAYVDLLRPQVQEAFMKTTYEQYYQHFGEDFGEAIPAIFSDEPSVTQCSKGTLPFSYWFAHEFQKRNGYDLLANLLCVFMDVEGECFDYPAGKVRFDYYDTIHALWTKNFVEATGTWCQEHGINWTGHYMEHLWPHVSYTTSPAIQSNYEYHQWPAIDMLFTNYLKDSPTHSVTHTIRELKSASNQFGKERALCELYGAGGWDSTFDDYKRMADWVMVNGVNFINQHLTYSTIMGARKHDHPQSFDWREPWWNEYTTMNDYLGRLSWMLSRGKMEQRILVLNPATTGYLTEAGKASGEIVNNKELDCITCPDMTEFLTLCQKLSDLQWDFDLGDEYTLARHGKAEEGLLKVVKQQYSCVIISGSMKNMLSSTAELLEACMKNGVKVIAVGHPGCYINGVSEEACYAKLAEGWENVELSHIDTYLGGLLSRRITASVPFPEGFQHMRRRLENGAEVWFFANQAMETYEADITLAGRMVRQLDLFTGEVRDIPYAQAEETLTIPMKLVRNQSLMVLVAQGAEKQELENLTQASGGLQVLKELTQDSEKASYAKQSEATSKIDMKLCRFVQECENVYPISYADYGDVKDTYVKTLCDRIFRERGFESNPWDNKVQFRRNIMDRDADCDERSGFTAAYHFTIADNSILQTISVVAEHPEYCHLRVNGNDVFWIPGETYLDYHFGVADISGCIKTGENIVEVIVDVFHVLMELDAIYIKGDFSVIEKGGKWVLSAPQELTYGSWKKQGLTFYPYAIQYEYAVKLDTVPKTAELNLGSYEATAVSLTVNGRYAGLLHADGKRAADIAHYLQPGDNKITIRVCGSYKNLLGPHFVRERGSAWPIMWRENPEHSPKAEQYDIMDYGLNEAPKMRIT